jgi:hypothetical protein
MYSIPVFPFLISFPWGCCASETPSTGSTSALREWLNIEIEQILGFQTTLKFLALKCVFCLILLYCNCLYPLELILYLHKPFAFVCVALPIASSTVSSLQPHHHDYRSKSSSSSSSCSSQLPLFPPPPFVPPFSSVTGMMPT